MHDVSGGKEKNQLQVVRFSFFSQEVEKCCNNKGCEMKVPERKAKKRERKTHGANFKEVFELLG